LGFNRTGDRARWRSTSARQQVQQPFQQPPYSSRPSLAAGAAQSRTSQRYADAHADSGPRSVTSNRCFPCKAVAGSRTSGFRPTEQPTAWHAGRPALLRSGECESGGHERETRHGRSARPCSAYARAGPGEAWPARMLVVRSGHEISGDAGFRLPRQSRRRLVLPSAPCSCRVASPADARG
jgi:hypothetical protein